MYERLSAEAQYLAIMSVLVRQAEAEPMREDRTSVGTWSQYGLTMRFPVRANNFPMITTKKVHFAGIKHELCWFLSGDTNTKYLEDNGVHIWKEWADENGDLGPIYGKQWRDVMSFKFDEDRGEVEWYMIDQMADLITTLKENPASRRHIVESWNVGELGRMALMPCHKMFQCHVSSKGELHLQIYQRSCDIFLGVPYNLSSYSLLLLMLAQECNLEPGDLIWNGGDVHLYSNHVEQAKLQLTRGVLESPQVFIDPEFKVLEPDANLIELYNYNSHQAIKAPVAI